jgi:putative transmembrane protein PGPGW
MSLEAVKKSPSRIWRLAAGWALTIGGLILGPVPILPGFVLLIPGLALLCAESRWLRVLLRRHKEKRLIRRAIAEAERVGIRLNLERDEPDEVPVARAARPVLPPDQGPGTGSAS